MVQKVNSDEMQKPSALYAVHHVSHGTKTGDLQTEPPDQEHLQNLQRKVTVYHMR